MFSVSGTCGGYSHFKVYVAHRERRIRYGMKPVLPELCYLRSKVSGMQNVPYCAAKRNPALVSTTAALVTASCYLKIFWTAIRHLQLDGDTDPNMTRVNRVRPQSFAKYCHFLFTAHF